MILLSKAMEVGRDHLIHRKRSPFPYEGKALTRRKVGVTYSVGRALFERSALHPAPNATPALICDKIFLWQKLKSVRQKLKNIR